VVNRFSVALLVLATASGCSGDPQGLPGLPVDFLSGSALPIERFGTAGRSFSYVSGLATESQSIVRDSVAWDQVWKQIKQGVSPVPPTPAVDFASEMVAVAAMGTRSTGGYTVLIEAATEDQGTVEVGVLEVTPGRGCITTQSVTQPVDLVRLPRRDGPVEFRVHRVVRDCS
jgi:hypothetical protein